MLAALSTLMCSTSALATYRVDVQCLDRVILTDVHAGYIKSASGGPDAGNAVVISWEKNYEQGSTSFHVFKNLNDYPGRGMFEMALLALERGLPVSAWGNDAQCSGGIHQLKITRSFNP
nr:hypothetical protein [Aeromonas sp. A35_P]